MYFPGIKKTQNLKLIHKNMSSNGVRICIQVKSLHENGYWNAASSICHCDSCNTLLQNVQCSYGLKFSALHLLFLLLQIARINLKCKYYSPSGGLPCLDHHSMMLPCCKWSSSCSIALSTTLKIYSSPLVVQYRQLLHGQSVTYIH